MTGTHSIEAGAGRTAVQAHPDRMGRKEEDRVIEVRETADGEVVIRVDTETEFWASLDSGHPIEVTRKLGDALGLTEGDGGHTPKEVWEARDTDA